MPLADRLTHENSFIDQLCSLMCSLTRQLQSFCGCFSSRCPWWKWCFPSTASLPALRSSTSVRAGRGRPRLGGYADVTSPTVSTGIALLCGSFLSARAWTAIVYGCKFQSARQSFSGNAVDGVKVEQGTDLASTYPEIAMTLNLIQTNGCCLLRPADRANMNRVSVSVSSHKLCVTTWLESELAHVIKKQLNLFTTSSVLMYCVLLTLQ